MKYATFFYVDFSKAELENFQFTELPFFQNVSFHNAKIINAHFDRPIFIDVDFSSADLNGTTINEAIIEGDTVRTCKNNQFCN